MTRSACLKPIEFDGLRDKAGLNSFSLTGASQVAIHNLSDASNIGILIRPHQSLVDNVTTVPWVSVNGTQALGATPRVQWSSLDVPPEQFRNEVTLSGATGSIAIAAQGGVYDRVVYVNGGATTVTALSGGFAGLKMVIRATNGNTTLTHSTVTANQFLLKSGANTTLGTNVPLWFVHNGTLWVQM